METFEKIKLFYEIFGFTNKKIHEIMIKDLHLKGIEIIINLYIDLTHCITLNKIPTKKTIKLMNEIWKKYSNDYSIFGIKDEDIEAIKVFKTLKNNIKTKNEKN